VSVAFVAALAVVADLAWATAVATTGPWYDSGISMQVYSIAFGGASILALILVGFAASRAARLDEEIQGLNIRLARFRAASRAAKEAAREDPLGDLYVTFTALEDTLVTPSVVGSGYVAVVDQMTREVLGFPGVSMSEGANRAFLGRILAQRRALLRTRASVWMPVVGPTVAAIGFALIGGIMLPGSEGFAATHYQLNTTLILFLSYGWAFLLAWSVAGIFLLNAFLRRPGTEPADGLGELP